MHSSKKIRVKILGSQEEKVMKLFTALVKDESHDPNFMGMTKTYSLSNANDQLVLIYTKPEHRNIKSVVDITLYCIDLTQIDKQKIIAEIDGLKQQEPNAELVLVGFQGGLNDLDDDTVSFNKIAEATQSQTYSISKDNIDSFLAQIKIRAEARLPAQKTVGEELLSHSLPQLSKACPLPAAIPLFQKEEEQLMQALKGLSETEQKSIKEYVATYKSLVMTNPQATEKFLADCKTLLDNSHAKDAKKTAYKAVGVFAAVVVVAALAALVSFGLIFATTWWLIGPGALFTAAIAAKAAAVTVVSLAGSAGLIAGGVTAGQGFFDHSQTKKAEMKALTTFTDKIKGKVVPRENSVAEEHDVVQPSSLIRAKG